MQRVREGQGRKGGGKEGREIEGRRRKKVRRIFSSQAVLAAVKINGLTHSHSRVPLKILSATFILLKITWE